MPRFLCFILMVCSFLFPMVLPAQEVLRGEVMVELEPVYGAYVDEKYPLEKEDAYKRALEEAALFFSAQIYGWSFDYDVGERARKIPENFELNPLGAITWGDPRLRVTHAEFRDMKFWAWMDYRPGESQLRRINAWKTGMIRNAQAVGHGPLGGPVEMSDWLAIRKTALEDSARAAVRAMLQGSERNRPKEAHGFISLQTFPAFFMDGGRWACSARFRIEIKEIVPFSAY
ncbi:hypothetical protein [Leadbettera azotonutricia]|uniref:Uncharacterized protein n=1 Tax=Leadbettera azotonutricia (strain ATCC BAA-888 / DSM 13862 / ZAS-9) TaxID=545695 RepID=F5Y8N0_LEAAZ|nr:hypothetical protein [Leadbettera azotonutricia]AEF82754.1 hypothetical protein TREAZ_2228 [Leadbettera azotonutricia ZAS-9]